MNPHTIKSLTAAATLSLLVPLVLAGDRGGMDAKFRKMDTDGDGRVSRAEHSAGARQMFQDCDADGDGVVTAMEMEMQTRTGKKPGHEMKRSSNSSSNRGEIPVSDMSAADKIKVIDADGDGRLTSAEHDAGSVQMFAKMDTDGDGFLSEQEMKSGHKMKHDKHRP